jgi:hypothetical protein
MRSTKNRHAIDSEFAVSYSSKGTGREQYSGSSGKGRDTCLTIRVDIGHDLHTREFIRKRGNNLRPNFCHGKKKKPYAVVLRPGETSRVEYNSKKCAQLR